MISECELSCERATPARLDRRVAGVSVSLAALLATAFFGGSHALAAGCQGQNATSDSGGRSVELAIQIQEETLAKAKANAGLSAIPTYGGVSVSGSRLKHDGYRLKTPVQQVDCTQVPIQPINELLPFETNTVVVSGLGELDLTEQFGLPSTHLFRVGAAIGGKWLRTKYSGNIFTPSSFSQTIGVNAGSGKLEESGVQIDLYSLLARNTAYLITAVSLGFGDSDVTNPTFSGLRFTAPIGTPGANSGVETAVFGGGRGSTDYRDVSVSGVVGNVFTLAQRDSRRFLLDLSGGLLYSSYRRDDFTDSAGVRYSDAETDEFSGKIEMKLAVEMLHGNDVITPFIRAGVKHRFDFDSSVTVFNPTTGLCQDAAGNVSATACDFTATYNLKSDNTFWRIGGGVGASLHAGTHQGAFEVYYEGSGDSREVVGKAQYIIKLR